MPQLLRDVRFGVRLLLRNPAFAAVTAATLALGIAANTAMFSVVYAALLAPLPYPHAEELVMVWSRVNGRRGGTSPGDYLDWKKQQSVFSELGAWGGRSVSLAGGASERPTEVFTRVTSPGFFAMTGEPFALGRDFSQEESEAGRDRVVILTHRTWREQFGGDTGIVGRSVRIDGEARTVVGVLAPGRADRDRESLFLPLAFSPDQINHDAHWLLLMGRLKPGVLLGPARAEMATLASRSAEIYHKGWTATVEPLKDNFLSLETVSALWLLLGAVGFVLLIACVNVANLLLARGAARTREVAVRASLGASRGQIVAQFLTESLLLAAAGGLLGLALTKALLKVVLALYPPFTLPTEADIRLHPQVLLFCLATTLVSGVVFGCVPAWQATRSSSAEGLKEAGRPTLGGGRNRLGSTLAGLEVALSLTLLAGGGLAIRSALALSHADPGFRTENLLTFSLSPARSSIPTERFYERLLESIRGLPGVTKASASTSLPFSNSSPFTRFHVAGDALGDPAAPPEAAFNTVTPEYFETLGIPLTRGRALLPTDRSETERVALVNEAFAKAYLPGRDPLVERLVVDPVVAGEGRLGASQEWQIVGVYRSVASNSLRREATPEITVPFAQNPRPTARVAVRTAMEPGRVVREITAIVEAADPDLPMANVSTMEQLVFDSLAAERFNAWLFGAFAFAALVLAVLGIYGVTSFGVAQRTREIGLRMALGAGRAQVLLEILREGLKTALLGTLAGSVGAYFACRAMSGLVFGTSALDPQALGLTAGALLLAALFACLVPARRAASVDPLVALRSE